MGEAVKPAPASGRMRGTALMELSARNQIAGTVTGITLREVMADVTVDIGNGQTLAAAITRSSVERMNLAEGDEVVVIIKWSANELSTSAWAGLSDARERDSAAKGRES
jgi:molybdopterin-binding protein